MWNIDFIFVTGMFGGGEKTLFLSKQSFVVKMKSKAQLNADFSV